MVAGVSCAGDGGCLFLWDAMTSIFLKSTKWQQQPNSPSAPKSSGPTLETHRILHWFETTLHLYLHCAPCVAGLTGHLRSG